MSSIRCKVCHKEIDPVGDEYYECCECGKLFCARCAREDPTIRSLGVCANCEEVYETEEDYWGWWGEDFEW